MYIVGHDIDLMKLSATGNDVLLLVDKIDEHRGLIITPDFGGKKSVSGVVMSIGSRVKADVRLGQRVLFNRFSGKEINYDNIKVQTVHENEIIAELSDDVKLTGLEMTRVV